MCASRVAALKLFGADHRASMRPQTNNVPTVGTHDVDFTLVNLESFRENGCPRALLHDAMS